MDADDIRAKKLSHSLHGLQQATLRFVDAPWHRPEDAFVSVAEAVSWAVALDAVLEAADYEGRSGTAYKDARGRSDDGKTVIGMKFVRHHVHHAAELLDFVFVNAVMGGFRGTRSHWVWTPLDDLEPLLDRQFTSGKGLYRTHLGGMSVPDTLLDANRFFTALEPPVPPLPPDLAGVPRPMFRLPDRWPPVQGDRHI